MSTAVQRSLANPAAAGTSSRALAVSLCVSALLVLAGCFRLVSTYTTFTQTYDEPAHIACGLEWWTFGTYTYEPQHPPLSRIAAALGPYLLGFRSVQRPDRSFWADGNRILYEGDYKRTLAAARWGNLLFYVLTCAVVWLWTRRLFGVWAAAAAVAVFSLLPPVLAHAGLATTDMAATLGVVAAAYTIGRWIDRPSWTRAGIAGLGLAVAVTSKFSTLLFLAISIPLILAIRWRDFRGSHVRSSFAVALSACILIWGVYRFSLIPITGPQNRPHSIVTKVLGSTGFLADLGNRLVEMPIPGSEIAKGLVWAGNHGLRGHPAYFMGENRTHGWWLFFPVVLLVKTPLPFLFLTAAGIISIARRRLVWTQTAIPLWMSAGIFVVCVLSTVNLGVRHILPVYPLLAIVGAGGAAALRRFKIGRATTVALAGSLAISSAAAHPDYLSYFNILAGSTPERILVESDLDWGQDLGRLSDWVKANNVKDLALGYFGSADIERHGLPGVRPLRPYEPATGWVAISVSALKLRNPDTDAQRPDGPFDWLESHKPLAEVGKCIRVYYINR